MRVSILQLGSAAAAGLAETPSQLCTISGKTHLCASDEAAVRQELVLGIRLTRTSEFVNIETKIRTVGDYKVFFY